MSRKKTQHVKFQTEYSEIQNCYLNDDSINLNIKFDRFLLDVHALIDKHCPKTKLDKKALKLRKKPWITNQIRKMMKVRDALFHRLKTTNSSTDLIAYKQFRNRIVNKIRKTILSSIL